jgi:hypothetical protein
MVIVAAFFKNKYVKNNTGSLISWRPRTFFAYLKKSSIFFNNNQILAVAS